MEAQMLPSCYKPLASWAQKDTKTLFIPIIDKAVGAANAVFKKELPSKSSGSNSTDSYSGIYDSSSSSPRSKSFMKNVNINPTIISSSSSSRGKKEDSAVLFVVVAAVAAFAVGWLYKGFMDAKKAQANLKQAFNVFDGTYSNTNHPGLVAVKTMRDRAFAIVDRNYQSAQNNLIIAASFLATGIIGALGVWLSLPALSITACIIGLGALTVTALKAGYAFAKWYSGESDNVADATEARKTYKQQVKAETRYEKDNKQANLIYVEQNGNWISQIPLLA